MARQSHPLPHPPPRPLPVLLTRPAAQGERFAAQLTERFGAVLTPVMSPLIQPRFVTPILVGGSWQALILSSESGAEAAARIALNAALPEVAYCVGDRTAQAARAFGFHAVSAHGDADALVALVLQAAVTGPLLHLHGADTRGDVAARLSAGGVPCTGAVAYVQEPHPLTQQATALLHGREALVVPLFSPRTASLFAQAAATATAPLLIAALGPAVAAASPPCARICVAQSPDAEAMLEAIAKLLDHWAITRYPT